MSSGPNGVRSCKRGSDSAGVITAFSAVRTWSPPPCGAGYARRARRAGVRRVAGPARVRSSKRESRPGVAIMDHLADRAWSRSSCYIAAAGYRSHGHTAGVSKGWPGFRTGRICQPAPQSPLRSDKQCATSVLQLRCSKFSQLTLHL